MGIRLGSPRLSIHVSLLPQKMGDETWTPERDGIGCLEGDILGILKGDSSSRELFSNDEENTLFD